MTVRQMLESMSAQELNEWMAYDMIEPIGNRRGDIQAALIAMTVANYSMTKKKGKTFGIQDFLLFTDKNMPTPEELGTKIASRLGAPV